MEISPYINIVDEYYFLKSELEIVVKTYGLSDPRTIKVSQDLDLLINKLMNISTIIDVSDAI